MTKSEYFQVKKANNNIILIGFMGSGKSLTSAQLARRLGKELVSTDEMIEEREGGAIVDIFQDSGEEYFRQLERKVVEEVSKKQNVVFDCGGGVVLDPRNLVDLKKNGTVIYLKASAEWLYSQVKDKKHRPLLNVEDPLRKIAELLTLREPLYEQADYVMDTDGKNIETITDDIIKLLSGL